MQKISLKVLGLSYSHTQTGAYILVLVGVENDKRIPIIIGGFEAQAIAIELENLKPPRPLTHDLFIDFATSFNIELLEVNIKRMSEGIFYSELICSNGISTIKLDARTSDAIALAIRCNCPIFTTKEIIEKAGVLMPNDEKNTKAKDSEKSTNQYSDYSDEKLNEFLKKVIEDENYEEATLINKEINKRKNKQK